MATEVFSVNEFCQSHAISKATFYNLRKRGVAPRIMKVGARTLISADAAAEWRGQMEKAASAPPSHVGGGR
jgi:predicted DNA-binding transcriptional regulator AlpA